MFREMSDILVTTILRDSWSVAFSSMAHRKGTVRRKEKCFLRSEQESGVREICVLRSTWRGMETSLRFD
jgi:hypothetical protein